MLCNSWLLPVRGEQPWHVQSDGQGASQPVWQHVWAGGVAVLVIRSSRSVPQWRRQQSANVARTATAAAWQGSAAAATLTTAAVAAALTADAAADAAWQGSTAATTIAAAVASTALLARRARHT